MVGGRSDLFGWEISIGCEKLLNDARNVSGYGSRGLRPMPKASRPKQREQIAAEPWAREEATSTLAVSPLVVALPALPALLEAALSDAPKAHRPEYPRISCDAS